MKSEISYPKIYCDGIEITAAVSYDENSVTVALPPHPAQRDGDMITDRIFGEVEIVYPE